MEIDKDWKVRSWRKQGYYLQSSIDTLPRESIYLEFKFDVLVTP